MKITQKSEVPGDLWRVYVDGKPTNLLIEEAATNARLIAAAPQLLEALEDMLQAKLGLKAFIALKKNKWQWPDDSPEVVSIMAENARAAIAAATGDV